MDHLSDGCIASPETYHLLEILILYTPHTGNIAFVLHYNNSSSSFHYSQRTGCFSISSHALLHTDDPVDNPTNLHFSPLCYLLLFAGPWCTFRSAMWMSSPQCFGSPSTERRWQRARFTIASCRWRQQTRTVHRNTARSATTRSPPQTRPSLLTAMVSR